MLKLVLLESLRIIGLKIISGFFSNSWLAAISNSYQLTVFTHCKDIIVIKTGHHINIHTIRIMMQHIHYSYRDSNANL